MNPRKIRKPTAAQAASMALTAVVLAASLGAGAWIVLALPRSLATFPAVVIATLAAIGVETILSTLADDAVKAVTRHRVNREDARA